MNIFVIAPYSYVITNEHIIISENDPQRSQPDASLGYEFYLFNLIMQRNLLNAYCRI